MVKLGKQMLFTPSRQQLVLRSYLEVRQIQVRNFRGLLVEHSNPNPPIIVGPFVAPAGPYPNPAGQI